MFFFYPCHLLITFANSLNPDQAQQNISDLGPNCLSLSDGFPERLFLKMLICKELIAKPGLNLLGLDQISNIYFNRERSGSVVECFS